MQRALTNLVRLPARTWLGLRRLADPATKLQRAADRAVPAWWDADTLARLDAVPGYSSRRELRLLAYLAGIAPAGGAIVEIGAYKGRSTAWLTLSAARRPDRPAVVSIDPHLGDSWDEFNDTLTRFALTQLGLYVIRGCSADSGETWDRPISFLWVDGSHEYADVVRDIELFVPHVVPGGWVVFDDAYGGHHPGVERAVAECMVGRPAFTHAGTAKHFELFRRNPARPCG